MAIEERGLFAYLPRANQTFFKTGVWPSFEEVLEENGRLEDLDLLTLPASEADEMLRLLWRHEITRHHLVPTLSNAASAYQYARTLFDRRQALSPKP